MINIIGPLIASDGIIAADPIMHDDFHAGGAAAMYGTFSGTKSPKVILNCNSGSAIFNPAIYYVAET